MISLRDLANRAQHEADALPQVVGESCVYALVETASCQACVDVCPTDAWLLDEEQLGIDIEKCDGCDLCVAACPQGAIRTNFNPALRSFAGDSAALLGCEPAAIKSDEGIIGCLHSFSLDALISLYHNGVRTLFGCAADCATCARGAAPSLSERVAKLNSLLRSRGLEKLEYREVDRETWQRLSNDGRSGVDGPAMDRRQFFRRATYAVVSESDEALGTDDGEETHADPPGIRLPRTSSKQIVPFAPTIDEASCNACGACVKLCPHQAIVGTTPEGEDADFYRVESDNCSGCGICVDVCDQDAIAVNAWVVADDQHIVLRTNRCRACGVPYKTTSAAADNSDLCRICAQKNHHSLLFQVLE